jgi:glycosyltransferase involved in cell wall biosynthesis
MTLLVRDEIDIVRQNIDFHLRHGVDFVIATDNGSIDGTHETLEEFAQQGALRLIDETGTDYAQHRWVSRMAMLARDEYGADWILNSDADEFWFAPGGTLKDILDTDADMIRCQRRNMLFAADRPPASRWFGDIVHRVAVPRMLPAANDWAVEPLPAPFTYLDLPGKVLCRAAGLHQVHQGNHSASYDRGTTLVDSGVVVYHYPVRSFDHFVRKITNGGAAYARNTELSRSLGWHWRRWYRTICDGEPELAFHEVLPTAERLDADIRNRSVIVDTTMQEALGAAMRQDPCTSAS